MFVWNGQSLLANDVKPERSLGPVCGSHNHKESLDVIQ